MNTLQPHITRYNGYDILHPTTKADWYTVTTKKGYEHYFVELRFAMDFIDELYWQKWGRK